MEAEEHVEKGIKLMHSGAWQQAESLFRQAIEIKADYPEAYYYLGVHYRRNGCLEAGVSYLLKAIELKPNYLEAYYLLGQIRMDGNRLDEAANLFYQVVKLAPNCAEAYCQLGIVLKHMSRTDGAEVCFRQAVELKPDFSKAYNNLGTLLNEKDKLDEAQAVLQQAIELRPDYAEAYNNLGVVQVRKKRLAEAAESFKQAIRIQPDNPYSYNNLGLNLKELGRHDEAAANFRQAIRINPHYAEAYHNLGLILKDGGQLEEAERYLRRAIELKPDFLMAYNNLVAVLAVANRYDEAETIIRQSLKLEPNSAEGHRRLGLILKMKHHLDEAEGCYHRAIELSAPEKRDEPCFGLAVLQLLRGKFGEAWENYDLRRRIFSYREPPVRYWQGEDLTDRKVLLFFEQGHGDTLHFVRFAEMVAKLAGETVVWVQRSLVKLLRSPHYRIHCGNNMPDEYFDFACSLHSLPGLFQISAENIPSAVPYLWPTNNVSAKWRKAINKVDSVAGYRVGVVWAGNPRHDNDRNRSIPFRLFSRLFAREEISWVSLQVGQRAADLSGSDYKDKVIDFSQNFVDFHETAGMIANLDLVITVDTAVAHLSGAMGKKTWILVPFTPDWRWQLDREDSPWYPSVRLFRQSKAGEWQTVLEDIWASLGEACPQKVNTSEYIQCQ